MPTTKKPKKSVDLSTRVLIQIRDRLDTFDVGLGGLRADLGRTNQRLDETVERLERLEQRQAQSEIRLATEIVAVVHAIHEVRDLLREDRAIGPRVDDHERRLEALERKVG